MWRRLARAAMAASAGALVFAAAANAQAPAKFTVHFGENETAIPQDGRAALGAAVEMAQECAQALVQLVGHDDGARAQEISLARADAVRKAIIDAGGVNASSIKTEARGKQQPLAPVAVGASDRQNRRVEVSVSCK